MFLNNNKNLTTLFILMMTIEIISSLDPFN